MERHPVLSGSAALWLAVGLLLAACGGRGEEPTPTFTVDQVQTLAVATFAADLTSTALAMPTDTPTLTATPSPSPTGTPAGTSTLAATVAATSPAATCYGLRFVSDVTIPDNSNMAPGQQFTKTWRVRNAGTCAWEAGFTLRFTGGEAMGGTSVALASAVAAGSETNLSVNLTAPTAAGTYRGNWRMATASGTFFGDEIFVLIVVGAVTPSATSNPSPTATLTPTETPTATTSP